MHIVGGICWLKGKRPPETWKLKKRPSRVVHTASFPLPDPLPSERRLAVVRKERREAIAAKAVAYMTPDEEKPIGTP